MPHKAGHQINAPRAINLERNQVTGGTQSRNKAIGGLKFKRADHGITPRTGGPLNLRRRKARLNLREFSQAAGEASALTGLSPSFQGNNSPTLLNRAIRLNTNRLGRQDITDAARRRQLAEKNAERSFEATQQKEEQALRNKLRKEKIEETRFNENMALEKASQLQRKELNDRTRTFIEGRAAIEDANRAAAMEQRAAEQKIAAEGKAASEATKQESEAIKQASKVEEARRKNIANIGKDANIVANIVSQLPGIDATTLNPQEGGFFGGGTDIDDVKGARESLQNAFNTIRLTPGNEALTHDQIAFQAAQFVGLAPSDQAAQAAQPAQEGQVTAVVPGGQGTAPVGQGAPVGQVAPTAQPIQAPQTAQGAQPTQAAPEDDTLSRLEAGESMDDIFQSRQQSIQNREVAEALQQGFSPQQIRVAQAKAARQDRIDQVRASRDAKTDQNPGKWLRNRYPEFKFTDSDIQKVEDIRKTENIPWADAVAKFSSTQKGEDAPVAIPTDEAIEQFRQEFNKDSVLKSEPEESILDKTLQAEEDRLKARAEARRGNR